MESLEQGSIIRIEGQPDMALVLSREYFNRTGMVIAVPICADGSATVLHVPVAVGDIHGLVHLEAMKGLDLRKRYYSMRGRLSFEQIQDISDTVQAIFDYIPGR